MNKVRLRVFQNRVPRIIFKPKRNKMIRGWRKLHKEELYNLYPSPSIIRIIKSRRITSKRKEQKMVDAAGVLHVI
jgi:hypothetical protein